MQVQENKPWMRKTKEERREMDESFVDTYRPISFPSRLSYSFEFCVCRRVQSN